MMNVQKSQVGGTSEGEKEREREIEIEKERERYGKSESSTFYDEVSLRVANNSCKWKKKE
jgi:hypothetical protein